MEERNQCQVREGERKQLCPHPRDKPNTPLGILSSVLRQDLSNQNEARHSYIIVRHLVTRTDTGYARDKWDVLHLVQNDWTSIVSGVIEMERLARDYFQGFKVMLSLASWITAPK